MVLSESIAFLIARNDAYRLTVLGNQEIDLTAANAVLTGAHALERLSSETGNAQRHPFPKRVHTHLPSVE